MQSVPTFFCPTRTSDFGAVGKVAVKLSGQKEIEIDPSDKGFIDIIRTLMQIVPEELEDSLGQLKWMPADTEGGMASPMIDLTKRSDIDPELLNHLFGEVMEVHHSAPVASEAVMSETSAAMLLPSDERFNQTAPSDPGGLSSQKLDAFIAKVPLEQANHHIQLKAAPAAKTDMGSAASLLHEGVEAISKMSAKESAATVSAETSAAKSAVAEVTTPDKAITENQLNRQALDQTIFAKPGAGKTHSTERVDPGQAPPRADSALVTSTNRTISHQTASAQVALQEGGSADHDRSLMAQLALDRNFSRQSGVQSKGPSDDLLTPGLKTDLSAAMAQAETATGKSSNGSAQQKQGRVFQPLGDDRESPQGAQLEENRAAGLRAGAIRPSDQTLFSKPDSMVQKSSLGAVSDHEVPHSTKELQNDVMRQIVQRMTLRSDGLRSRMNIQLKPEFLGRVQLQVFTENQQVAVRMTTESLAVKEMIEQHMQHLRSELHQHGLEVDKFEVFVGNENENWKSSQENAGFRHAMQQKNGRRPQQTANERDQQDEGSSNHSTPDGAEDSGEIDYFA